MSANGRYVGYSDGTNVYIWDGVSASNTFVLTVVPVNDPPTLDSLPDLTLGVGAGAQTVLLTGISSGATLWAALQLAEQMDSGQFVVIFGDRGERYLSTDLCAHARN